MTDLTGRTDFGPVADLPEIDRMRVMRYVACNSDDATEARDFMEMLGLIEP